MAQTTEAIYERGVLRPVTRSLHLQEGQRVRIIIEPIPEPAAEELAGRETAFLERMKAEGRVLSLPPPAEPPPADWKPLTLAGEPLSETILKMRGEAG
jgi:predicted DNA-binding antitoxin AbrB/MazE fold protein